MTKKINSENQSQLELKLYRLRVIAQKLETNTPLSDEERFYLAKALGEIGDGKDPTIALDIKAAKGEKKSSKSINREMRLNYVLSWVAASMQPPPDGLGYDLDTAIEAAAEFEYRGMNKLTEETIRHYWTNNAGKHKPDFKPPIRFYPLKEPKS